uniref:Uncharacterized protein n=1 Tax=Schizaphis graminum TaxID=13262 RepID=A0A2S2N8I0_SCHGA
MMNSLYKKIGTSILIKYKLIQVANTICLTPYTNDIIDSCKHTRLVNCNLQVRIRKCLATCFITIYSLVKDTFKKYSSTDTDTFFQKYLKYVFEYSKKKVFKYKYKYFKKVFTDTFKYFFFLIYVTFLHWPNELIDKLNY